MTTKKSNEANEPYQAALSAILAAHSLNEELLENAKFLQLKEELFRNPSLNNLTEKFPELAETFSEFDREIPVSLTPIEKIFQTPSALPDTTASKQEDAEGSTDFTISDDESGESPDILIGDENELDAAEEEGTSPSVFSDKFIETRFPNRTQECDVTLSVTPVKIPFPKIGQVQGLDEASRVIQSSYALLGDIANHLRQTLPGWADKLLEGVLGKRGIPPTLPPHVLIAPLYIQVLYLIGKVETELYKFPPKFSTQEPPIPNPTFSPKTGSILIKSKKAQRVRFHLYSKMTSTYTFGKGKGTSYFDTSVADIVSPRQTYIDRSWFAKAFILRSTVEDYGLGIPFKLRGTKKYYLAQLGVNKDETAMHDLAIKLDPLAHGAKIPLRPNGNYGKVRIVVVPTFPCKVLTKDLEITGPYEEDIATQENNRFSQVEAERDAVLQKIVGLQRMMLYLGIMSTIPSVPVLSPLVNFTLRGLEGRLLERKEIFVKEINKVNKLQRAQNYRLAEAYPERGPAGGDEDNPL